MCKSGSKPDEVGRDDVAGVQADTALSRRTAAVMYCLLMLANVVHVH